MAGYYINGTKYTTGLQLIAQSGALNDDFIQGNTHVVSFTLDAKFPSTLTSLRCFPNLKYFIIMKTDAVVDLNSNIFDGTLVLVSGKIIVPNTLLASYKAAYPLWEAAFDSWQFQIEFTIPYVGNSELTIDYVEQVVAISGGQASAVTKVIVPVGFTSYESGSIDAIISAFPNMEVLTTTYSGGTIDLDMNGDVVAKIVEIGKTVDEALVYARTVDLDYSRADDTNLIIAPPTILVRSAPQIQFIRWFKNCSNLVLVDGLNVSSVGYEMFGGCSNLIEVKNMKVGNGYSSANAFWWGCNSVKRIEITFPNGSPHYEAGNIADLSDKSYLEKLILNGFGNGSNLYPVWIKNTAPFTRQALVDLINSLGTPSTQKTLTIGATNLAKLQTSDIQLAYDKNWAISPAPSAFSFTIGSDTYSCDFGMTWAQWVASAYNTAGFTVSSNKVYDANNQVVQKNGTDVADTDMVRYGDTYTLASATPVFSDLTDTAWLLNNNISLDSAFSYNLNFFSNGSNYSLLEFDDERQRLYYGSTSVNAVGTWNDQGYRTIGITGGTDATNATLIAWLQANATQLQGHVITVTYQGIYDCEVYDGQDSTGTLLASLDSSGNGTATVVCSSGYIYVDGIGSLSITGANGATSSNPSTVSANGATITIVQTGGGGGG